MRSFLVGVLILSSALSFSAYADDLYLRGYDDGYKKKHALEPNIDDYMRGWDDGLKDVLDGLPYSPRITEDPEEEPPSEEEMPPEDEPKEQGNPPEMPLPTPTPTPPIVTMDDDPDEKRGGKDPIVFGEWHYVENDGLRCQSLYPFDYDNDGFRENFCYRVIGGILAVDFGGGIKSGYNILNFENTAYAGMTPIQYLEKYPDTCIVSKCYIWNDYDLNWVSSKNELEPINFGVWYVVNYPFGELHDNNRYIYCEGETMQHIAFYCIQPTYWAKGIR